MVKKDRRNIEELSADDLLRRIEEPRRKRRKLQTDELEDVDSDAAHETDEDEDGKQQRISRHDDDDDSEEETEEEDSDVMSGSEEEDEETEEEVPTRTLPAVESLQRISMSFRTRIPENLPLPKSSAPKSPTSFAELGASKALVASLSSMSIRAPTEVQAACIPPLIDGESVSMFLIRPLLKHNL